MASSNQITENSPNPGNRRATPRRRLNGLAYITMGADNGGILIDIGEGGLNCHVVGAVVENEICHTKFALPGMKVAIEADCQVMWSNSSKKGGGVKFVNLDDAAREQIRLWVSGELVASEAEKQSSLAAVATPAQDSLGLALAAPVQSAHPKPDTAPAASAPSAGAVFANSARLSVRPDNSLAADPLNSGNVVAQEKTPAKFGVIAIAGFVLLTALGIILLESGRISAWFRETTDASSKVTPSGAVKPGAKAVFQVEVIDATNKHWILTSSTTEAKALSAEIPRIISRPAEPEAPRSSPAPKETAVDTRSVTQRLVSPFWAPRVPSQARPSEAPIPVPNVAPSGTGIPAIDLRTAAPPPPVPARSATSAAAAYQNPVLVHRVEPKVPQGLSRIRAEGTVELTATIGKDGTPRNLVIVNGDPRLAAYALDAIRQWRYKPASLNGQTIEAPTSIVVHFQLNN